MSSPEYITFLANIRGESGDTRLLAGTRSRLFCNTGLDGNWRLLLANSGGDIPVAGVPETRWKSAQMGNIVLLTNGVDQPYWWSFEKPSNDDGFSAELIDDLVALDISAVQCVASWRGFVFLGNSVSEGLVNQNRVYWSDFNDPLSYTPLPDSLAGYIDLGSDERVLAMAPLGGQFRVYTDKAVYDVNLVGGDEVFNFREVYRGPQVLRFPNSLINLGDSHIYGGEDTLYIIGELDRSPRLIDWMYRAAGAIYNGVSADYLGGIPTDTLSAFGPINRSACHLLTGGYDEASRILWFSWAADTDIVPTKSLVMQMDIGKACVVDSGFTAFCSHIPSYNVSVRRWLADMGICNPVPIASEGNPSPQRYIENSSLTSIRNATENPNLPATDGSSVCDAVADNPSLEPDCTPCGNGYKFIMASAQDKCLKEYDASYYAREYCTTAENQRSGLPWTATDHPTTVANYTEYGYVSVIQTDSMDVGTPNNKTVSRIVVEYDAPDVPDDLAAKIIAEVGYGSQPRKLIWQSSTPRPIDRLSAASEAAMLANNIRPNKVASFQFFRTGSQIAYRLMISDASKGPVKGGSAALNEMNVSIRGSHGDYF